MTEVHHINSFEKYFSDTLFKNSNVCKFYDEVIIDDIPCFITLKYFKEDGRVRLILHKDREQSRKGPTPFLLPR